MEVSVFNKSATTSSVVTSPYATGGTIAIPISSQTGYGRIFHYFYSNGTFAMASALDLEIFAVGGGGGGGGNYYSGGGGGGGVGIITYLPLAAGSYSVTIGNGGAVSTNGGATTVGSIVSVPGGGNGAYGNGTGAVAGSGGSGGGGSPMYATAGGTGGGTFSGYTTLLQYSNIGAASGVSVGGNNSSGGGGGAGSAGVRPTTLDGGAGGSGILYYGNYYAGGGGGGAYPFTGGTINNGGTGGVGGGGNGGGTGGGPGSSGSPNTGGGGGGAGGFSVNVNTGGKGIVIISYPTLYSFSSTTLSWPTTTGYTQYTGAWTSIDDGYSTTPITLPVAFSTNATSSTSLYMGTNGYFTIGAGTNSILSSPSLASPAVMCGNPADLWLQTGLVNTDGDTHNWWYQTGTKSGRSYVKNLVFCGTYGTGLNQTAKSWLANFYRDSTYQWFETRIKSTSGAGTCGPYNATSVALAASTTSQVWRGDLNGQNWVFMGNGSVV